MKDRSVEYDGPSLFAEFDQQAELERAQALEKATKEVEATAEKRRKESKKQPEQSNRPKKYNTYGLPVVEHVEYPGGITKEEYETLYNHIAQDEVLTLHCEPPRIWLEKTILPKGCPKADKNMPAPQIDQAPRPHSVIGGGHVAADFLASIINNKFNHHLPEYRQAKMFAEQGLDIPTSTLNDWVHATANVLYPLYESQREAVMEGGYLQIDEVPWNIADRKGKACRKGYAWQFQDVSPHPRGTYFYYHKGSRAGEIPRTQLLKYHGAIQTDGYKVYDHFESVPGITLLACMAHIRRKFVEAQKFNPLAGEAVKCIATLYTLEENLKQADATAEEIRQTRQRLAVPILQGLEAWMNAALSTCTPSDPLAKAIKYALLLWPRVMRYTEDGRYHIDSNAVERGQRPSALGRKNYLFSQNDRGAEDNAIFYTFIVSCQVLNINPYDYLKDTLERIRPDMDEQQLTQLLPCNYPRQQ
ncbi:MAG: IS66 family transposase [Muribaculaceae bacterium]